MKRQLFQKVFIKSESDLPKEECFIITKPKVDNGYLLVWRWFRVCDKGWWINNIEWYLLPIDLSKECHCGGYPECICEISKKSKSDPHNDIYGPGLDNYGRDKLLYGPEPAKQLMKDKFSQSELAMQPKQTADIIRETLTSFAKYWNTKSGCEIITYSDISRYKKQLNSK